jgi:cytochrome b561
MQSKKNYSAAQIVLHWAIALLIGLNYLISDHMNRFFRGTLEGQPAVGFVPMFHVYAGVAVLVLVLVRLIFRMRDGAPAPIGGGTLLDRVAGYTHAALYVLMFVVPALGAATWFGGIKVTADLHVLTMNAMMLLVLAHAFAGIFHHFVLKDGLMSRMVRFK